MHGLTMGYPLPAWQFRVRAQQLFPKEEFALKQGEARIFVS